MEFVDSPLVQKSFTDNMSCRISPDLAVINRRRLRLYPRRVTGLISRMDMLTQPNFPPSSGHALDVAFHSVEFEKDVAKPLARREQYVIVQSLALLY